MASLRWCFLVVAVPVVVCWQEVFGCCVVAGVVKPSPHPGGKQARRQATQRLTTIFCVQPLPRTYPSSSSASSTSSSCSSNPASSRTRSLTPQHPILFALSPSPRIRLSPRCVHGETVNSSSSYISVIIIMLHSSKGLLLVSRVFLLT